MSSELFWLVLTVAMTVLGPLHSRPHHGARAHGRDGQSKPERQDAIAMGRPADGRACQCRGKPGHFRASCFDSAGAEHHNDHDRICLRAIFLVAVDACGGLHARNPGVAHAVLCRRFRGAGPVGAAIFKLI